MLTPQPPNAPGSTETPPPGTTPAMDGPVVAEAPTQDIDTSQVASPETEAGPPPRWKSILKTIGWSALGLFLIAFFTLIKLPEEQIKTYIQATLSSVLADQGMTLTTGQSSLSYWFGISYTMKDVTLTAASGTPVKLEEIDVSPSLLSLLTGKQGASFTVKTPGGGKLTGSGSIRNTNYSFSFKASDLDVRKSGVLDALAHVTASGQINGAGSVSGDLNNPQQTNGGITLDLAKVGMDPQSILGFSIPKISISEAKADLEITKGKVQIKTLTIGKKGNPADDIQAAITGDMTLARQLEASSLNLKAKFTLSEGILKSFVLLDTLLSSGKQPDGSYGFQLAGTMMNPVSEPLKQ